MKYRYMCFSVLLLFSFVTGLGACKTRQAKPNTGFTANYPPQALGTAHLNIVKRFSDVLQPRDISFVFEPGSNYIKFHHKMMGDNIWVYLSKENRTEMRNAIAQYLEAFSAQSLTPTGAKKKGAFGVSDVVMTWGLFGSAHKAFPELRFDYQFITPKRPYFILAASTVTGTAGRNSPAIRIAVSPAQCKDILPILDEQNLQAIIEDLKADYDKFVPQNTAGPEKAIEDRASETETAAEEQKIPFEDF